MAVIPKERIMARIIIISLAVIMLSGCTFVIKDDHAVKYYGIDDKRGNELLNQILARQQQEYEAANGLLGAKKP
jgi:hypothetical protein